MTTEDNSKLDVGVGQVVRKVLTKVIEDYRLLSTIKSSEDTHCQSQKSKSK